MRDPLVEKVLRALESAIDPEKLRARMGDEAPSSAAGTAHGGAASDERLVLADILDASILGARAGEKSFPLRILFSRVAEHLHGDEAFTFACGISFYFRAAMDEESKMRLGIEVSRAFYAFASAVGMTREETAQTAPLVAALMNGELARVKLESVDHMNVFDSQVHERAEGADSTRAAISGARTFLCRVAKTNVVRAKALVVT